MPRHQRTPETIAADVARAIRIWRGMDEALLALQNNRCPTCGKGVRRNLSLTGWVQCAQFGAPGFRQDATLPPCPWQGFYE